ncbi:MAG TPA: ABC transporter ATP-binding protein [Gemmatimonadales bacterium]|nr:ABC transporter ATP-binding protein [Gemmatimonadales bacterium]
MIRATALGKRYGEHVVLDGLSLTVEAGERVALLGTNGAGKTTLMRCLLGLTDFSGHLEIAGLDVRDHGREVRGRLGYVPQRAPHFEGTLAETVEFLARLRDLDPRMVADRLATLGFHLGDHAEKPVRALSGGMLQKVLLALALASDVPLLLLDEPTSNLDPATRKEFLRVLSAVSPETTVLLASHRLADVEAVAHRLVVLDQGRVAYDGELADLRDRLDGATTFWIVVAPDAREPARKHLATSLGLQTVSANGAAIGVRAPARARAEVIVGLHEAGIPVQRCWTEQAALADLLGEMVRGNGAGAGRP